MGAEHTVHWKHEDHTTGYGSETFLPSRVPYLDFYPLPIQLHVLCLKVNPADSQNFKTVLGKDEARASKVLTLLL